LKGNAGFIVTWSALASEDDAPATEGGAVIGGAIGAPVGAAAVVVGGIAAKKPASYTAIAEGATLGSAIVGGAGAAVGAVGEIFDDEIDWHFSWSFKLCCRRCTDCPGKVKPFNMIHIESLGVTVISDNGDRPHFP